MNGYLECIIGISCLFFDFGLLYFLFDDFFKDFWKFNPEGAFSSVAKPKDKEILISFTMTELNVLENCIYHSGLYSKQELRDENHVSPYTSEVLAKVRRNNEVLKMTNGYYSNIRGKKH